MDTPKYTVLTRCTTYNHAPFIVDTMNGFCMQKTTFPYINVIIDDASTDEEQDVILNYLQDNFNLQDNKVVRREETDDYKLIFAQHSTNKNCFFAVLFLKYNHYRKKSKLPYYAEWREASTYTAFCEGDDYWTDPNKLQRQVEFLKTHPDYSAIGENGTVINTITNTTYPFRTAKSYDVPLEDAIIYRRFPTAGVLCRTKVLEGIYSVCRFYPDTIMWCWLISKGKVRFDETKSSVYRHGNQGITESTDPYRFAKRIESWNLEILRCFDVKPKFIYLHVAKIYNSYFHQSLNKKRYTSAFRCLWRGAWYVIKYIVA